MLHKFYKNIKAFTISIETIIKFVLWTVIGGIAYLAIRKMYKA